MFFTGSIAGFVGAKVAGLAAFDGAVNQSDLVAQAQLFHGLFVNIALALAVTIVLWFIVSLYIKKTYKS